MTYSCNIPVSHKYLVPVNKKEFFRWHVGGSHSNLDDLAPLVKDTMYYLNCPTSKIREVEQITFLSKVKEINKDSISVEIFKAVLYDAYEKSDEINKMTPDSLENLFYKNFISVLYTTRPQVHRLTYYKMNELPKAGQ
jgi:hypothetical protein